MFEGVKGTTSPEGWRRLGSLLAGEVSPQVLRCWRLRKGDLLNCGIGKEDGGNGNKLFPQGVPPLLGFVILGFLPTRRIYPFLVPPLESNPLIDLSRIILPVVI